MPQIEQHLKVKIKAGHEATKKSSILQLGHV